MFLKYGTFTHPLGEAAVTITRRPVETDARTRYAVLERWDIQGMISNPSGSPAAMTVLLSALESAYSVDGRDIALFLPDNSTPSQHGISSSTTIGGTYIVAPVAYPQGGGVEYVTVRHFTVSIEALRPTATPTGLLSFSESITQTGGGPRFGHLEPLAGPPVKQLLKQRTIYRATQSGQALGLYSYPHVPAAIWPAHLLELPDISFGSPRRTGYGGAVNFTEFPVQWDYKFESAQPLLGAPHLWR